MTAWRLKSQDLKICEQFLRVFGKTTPYGKIFKILFRKFTKRHRSTLLCSNVVKICPMGKTVKSCIIRMTKNLCSFWNCRCCMDHAQDLPGQAPNIWLTLFQISSKSVNFRRSYSRKRQHPCFCPTKYFQYSSEAKHRFGQITRLLLVNNAWYLDTNL